MTSQERAETGRAETGRAEAGRAGTGGAGTGGGGAGGGGAGTGGAGTGSAAFDPGVQLGPRLRRVREDRGVSVRELARRINCSPSLISQIERGLSAPSVGILYAIASELRTSLDFLFGVAAGGDAMMVTAHGDGHIRPEDGNGAGSPGGHP